MDSGVLFILFSPLAFVVLGVAGAIYLAGVAVYRLFYSPISHIPGPRIAAVTHWYEFYHDVLRGGQYVWKVAQMHDKYGPVVRINPDEVHVADPDFYAVLYNNGQERRDKVFKHTRQFGAPDSVLAAVHHDLHRMRRATLSSYFSKASVYRLEPVIQDKIDNMIDHMELLQNTKGTVPLMEMFTALTNDVVMEYAFARSEHRLTKSDWDPELLHAFEKASDMAHIVLHMNWVLRLLQALPLRLAMILNPGMGKVVAFQDSVKDQIRDIQTGRNRSNEKSSHRTIFHEVLDSQMPESEKKLERMWQEGMVVVGAGTETTAWTLVVGIVNILLNPEVRERLENEIKAAKGEKSSLDFKQLEQLPYLSACIKESLRLSYGVTSRLPRIAPNDVLQVPGTGLPIPPGTKVSMNAVMIHQNPKLFPQPLQFRPERWLDNPRLDRYLVSFSKGARQCIGINLAYAELYMGLGAIFSRFTASDDGPQLRLIDPVASVADIELAGDFFVPATKSGNKKTKVHFQ